MKKLITTCCIIGIIVNLSFSKDITNKLDQLLLQYQKSQFTTLEQIDSEKILSMLDDRKAPYAILYEHTGLYRWQLLFKCYYEYAIDTTASYVDVDVNYEPNDDLFKSIPAYFTFDTRRPYSLENYKSLMVTVFKSLGTSVTVLIDRQDNSFGYQGYEYCQSFYYSGSKLIIYSKFVKVDEIACVIYYMTSDSYYNTSLYKIFFDLILSLVEFKPFTNISEKTFSKPKIFNLQQNYPNPFNDATTINYSIDKPSIVKLEIFNINGSWIKDIFDKFHEQGEYSIDLNISDLPSGIYFYRLSDNVSQKTNRMILLK